MNWHIFKKAGEGKFKVTGQDKNQLHFHPNFAWRALAIILVILLVGGLGGLYYLFSTISNEEQGDSVKATVAELGSINQSDITKLSAYLDARATNFTRYQTEKPLAPDPSVSPK